MDREFLGWGGLWRRSEPLGAGCRLGSEAGLSLRTIERTAVKKVRPIRIFSQKKFQARFFSKKIWPDEKFDLTLQSQIGRIPEWPNGADCKSAGLYLRWFESIFAHSLIANLKRFLSGSAFLLSLYGALFGYVKDFL